MQTLSFNTEKLINTFLEMVRIDSPSGDEGLMRDYMFERVEALGLTSRTDPGGNLIVEVPKNRCDHDRILVLSGHLDVVPPCHGIQPVVTGSGEERIIQSDTTTVLGADDKSGLTAILEVVERSLKENLPRPQMRLLFTTREETMLGGAKELDDEALQAHFAVTLDHTGKQGTIIIQAPTYYDFTIECSGKSVHAGIMPEKGINAIVFASRIIDKLQTNGLLGRVDENTTSNLGFFEGGKATNIVPDKAMIRGELRGHNPLMLTETLEWIEQICREEKEKYPGTDFTFVSNREFEGYRLDENMPGLQRVVQAAKTTGLTPQLITTNGGSDNNVFMLRGLPGVVLSAGYVEPHSLKERIKVSELCLCTEFLGNIVEAFSQETF